MAVFTGNKNEYSSSSADTYAQQNERYSSSSDTNVNSPEAILNGLISQCIIEVNGLKKDVDEVKKAQNKTSEFYSSISSLAKTSRKLMQILMAVPVIQLILCVAVIYFLGIENQLPGFLIWAISGIGILSLIEVGITLNKINTFENKIAEVEKKLDELENQR